MAAGELAAVIRPWILVATFFALQVAVVATAGNGPFVDEGTYIAVGQEVLAKGRTDARWIGGCPYLFPPLVGWAFNLGGLFGARVLAAGIVSLSLLPLHRFADALTNFRTASFALLGLCTSGLFFSVAHLAVYDALALLGWALVLQASTPSDHAGTRFPGWAMGVLGALTTLSKYAMLVPLSLLLVVLVIARSRSYRDLALAVATFTALFVGVNLIVLGEPLPVEAFHAILSQGAEPRIKLLGAVLDAMLVQVALASVGIYLSRPNERGRNVGLLCAALTWPLLHMALGRGVSMTKHAVVCMYVLVPLIGVTLAWLAQRPRPVLTLGAILLVGHGAIEAYVHDRTWSDVRPLAGALSRHLRPGDRLGFQHGWALAPFPGSLKAAAILDETDLGQLPPGCACTLNWLVGIQYQAGAKDDVLRMAESCEFDFVADVSASHWYVSWPWLLTARARYVLFARPKMEARLARSSECASLR